MQDQLEYPGLHGPVHPVRSCYRDMRLAALSCLVAAPSMRGVVEAERALLRHAVLVAHEVELVMGEGQAQTHGRLSWSLLVQMGLVAVPGVMGMG